MWQRCVPLTQPKQPYRRHTLCALRKQTMEPIRGVIKETLGFRRLNLRGLQNVPTEGTLLTLTDNPKRPFHTGSAPLAA